MEGDLVVNESGGRPMSTLREREGEEMPAPGMVTARAVWFE